MLRTPFRTTTRTLARLSTTPRTAITTATSTPAVYSRLFSSNAILRSLHNNDNNDRKEHHGEAGNAAAAAAAGAGALRQKSVPTPGTNEDADSAISGFMNMFNERESRTVSITTCTKHGFVTTEAITLQGPVLCIGGQVFLWDIFKEGGAVDKYLKKKTTAASSSPASSSTTATPQQPARSIFEMMDEDTAKQIFKVFELMNPRPEILIVGTGKAFAPLSPAVRAVVRSLGLQVDMMSTANAAATYNMLAEEGREVAAALLPLEPSTAQIIRNNRQ